MEGENLNPGSRARHYCKAQTTYPVSPVYRIKTARPKYAAVVTEMQYQDCDARYFPRRCRQLRIACNSPGDSLDFWNRAQYSADFCV